MENQDAIIRYNFDKQKDPKTGMWYAICKWCEKKCSMRVSGGFGMAIKHMESCDKAKGTGDKIYSQSSETIKDTLRSHSVCGHGQILDEIKWEYGTSHWSLRGIPPLRARRNSV
ncbi:unnamed protein product [Cuscuta europaea]|uniref:Uncharacterized protein n=1 Tax=Cuscuta europaea TaxID=41803 RepID=A0A9P1EGH5_CUSEU|nr:unnamed protein product [Cuscuta europaea]